MKAQFIYTSLQLLLISFCLEAQNSLPTLKVIGYFSGKEEQVDSIDSKKLTHIIFSFCHLKGNQLHVDSRSDSVTITKLAALKKQNPHLKILLSLGGWGGCESCSQVFSTNDGRKEFAKSVVRLGRQFGTDGIDLDWEYPAIEGYPGHAYSAEDREHFTQLIKNLRQELGPTQEISFAAGGFKKFLEESVDWQSVMPLVDRVNLMTYDLVNGYSTRTGHHTPLYSSAQQSESTDFAVEYLIKKGIPKEKLVIGAAFYARTWENVSAINNGLYQPGKFKSFMDYKKIDKELSKENGFDYFWDSSAQAPFFYNVQKKIFATFDDTKSIRLKTKYAIDKGLQGIMFWELSLDKTNGLLSTIDSVRNAR